MKDKMWELFKLTGNINYYLMYKEIEKQVEVENANKKGERNSYKRH